jgi:predicted transcriptional regulator of viral defense system
VEHHRGPSWDALYEIAAAQEGHFSIRQAARAGYSPQLLAKYLHGGKVVRVRRGIYRLVHFPSGEHEDLIAFWLWSEGRGVFSHSTALFLHGLSDAMPSRAFLTVPSEWETRRLRVPEGVVLHYSTLGAADRSWVGPVPVTAPRRTLADCVATHVSIDLLRQAAVQAIARGLVTRQELKAIEGGRDLQPGARRR